MLFNKKILVILLSLLFFLGCNNSRLELKEEKGAISLNVPVMSDIVSDTLTKTVKGQKKRALLVADIIEYEIYSGNDLYQTGSIATESIVFHEGNIDIYPGTYTMVVNIYNLDVSSELPVSTGFSEEFVVESGLYTPVIITTIPNSPTVVDSNDVLTLYNSDFVPTIVADVFNVGSEMWFEYTALYDNTELTFDFVAGDYNTEFIVFLYNSEGLLVDVLETLYNDSMVLSGSAGDIYYIGVLYVDLSEGSPVSALNEVTLLSSEYIPVVEPEPPVVVVDNIVASDTWQVLEITFGESNFYTVDVTPGSTYVLSWDDAFNGSGTYSADVWVSVDDNLGNNYIYQQDSGFSNPVTLTIPDGVSTLTVEINGNWNGGFLGVFFQEVN